MIEVNRRALYNTLRMNWLLEKSMQVSDWQVLDYRTKSVNELFEMLKACGLSLDRHSYLAFSENYDTPEELTEMLLGDSELPAEELDRIYLIIFEIWRKLLPEKQSLSVFCDELDHQIYAFDTGTLEDLESIEDMLANLQIILDENVDQGMNPHEAFATVMYGCANDIESFLYDFIYEQIDNENYLYADELLEAFKNYVHDAKWFAYLQVCVVAASDSNSANQFLRQLIKKTKEEQDFSFFIELISFLSHTNQTDIFKQLVHLAVPLIEIEDDFSELLLVCHEFYTKIDRINKANMVQSMVDKRSKIDLDTEFSPKDKDLAELLKMIE